MAGNTWRKRVTGALPRGRGLSALSLALCFLSLLPGCCEQTFHQHLPQLQEFCQNQWSQGPWAAVSGTVSSYAKWVSFFWVVYVRDSHLHLMTTSWKQCNWVDVCYFYVCYFFLTFSFFSPFIENRSLSHTIYLDLWQVLLWWPQAGITCGCWKYPGKTKEAGGSRVLKLAPKTSTNHMGLSGGSLRVTTQPCSPAAWSLSGGMQQRSSPPLPSCQTRSTYIKNQEK